MIVAAVKKRRLTVPRRLLAWYDKSHRDLPWRRTKDPYAVWLSEIMLQQTQVTTVLPYYEKFLGRFPTVHDLAAAPIDDVLQLWSGLGYYSRARNLHMAAQNVVREFGGRFPNSAEELRKLPGVGRYTAAAIASICFDRHAAVVDGNVIRVLARLFNVADDTRKPSTVNQLWDIADALAPSHRCGDYNQAIMELGATICTPGATAQCSRCPLRAHCAAHKNESVAELPRKSSKAEIQKETFIVVAILDDQRWLIRRRPDDGLWGGLWELPTMRSSRRPTASAIRQFTRSLGVVRCAISAKPFCHLTHQLSHRTIQFIGYACKASTVEADRDHRLVTLNEFNKLGISQAMRRIAECLAQVSPAKSAKLRGSPRSPRRQSRHGTPAGAPKQTRTPARRIA